MPRASQGEKKLISPQNGKILELTYHTNKGGGGDGDNSVEKKWFLGKMDGPIKE